MTMESPEQPSAQSLHRSQELWPGTQAPPPALPRAQRRQTASPPPPAAVVGTVKRFSVRKGCGFITTNDTKADVVVHQTAMKKDDPRKYLQLWSLMEEKRVQRRQMSLARVAVPAQA